MAISEPDRFHLYEAARSGEWDERAAGALMNLLPPVGWADVATRHDLAAFAAELRGEITASRAHADGGLAELRGEITASRVHTDGGLAELRGELHHEIARLRYDLAVQTRTIVFTMLGLFVAGAGVAVGVARFVA